MAALSANSARRFLAPVIATVLWLGAGLAVAQGVALEPGAKLTALYIKSGDEYILTGPSQVQFQAGGPKVLSGAAAQKRASPVGKGGSVTIKTVNVAQAAYVMRSSRTTARIKLLTLS